MHVGDELPLDSPDTSVLAHAAAGVRVLVAADTDFGTLLADHGLAAPSLVLFRRRTRRRTRRRPVDQALLLLRHLSDVEDDLARGAVVVIEETRIRVRRLPLGQ